MTWIKRCGKIRKWALGGILLGLFLLRIIHLDLDLPGFGIAFYQPIDEGIYSRMALNLYNNGSLYRSGEFELSTSPTFRTNIFGNVAQFVSMRLLGDNYYGFRLPYLLAALGVAIIVLKIINAILTEKKVTENVKKTILVGAAIYIIFDFSFLMGSRVVENSILRALIVSIMLGGFWKFYQSEKKSYITIGFCAVFSIFLVYFSNVFVLVPLGILFLNQIIRKQFIKAKKIFIFMFAGGVAAFILAELYYLLVWGEGALHNFFESIFSYSNRIGGGGGNIFIKYLSNIGWFWGANIFFFSYILLFFVLLALFFNTLYAIKKNDEKCLFAVSFIWGLFIQSIFTSDYIERKCLSIWPVVIVNIVYFITVLKETGWHKQLYGKISFLVAYVIGIFLWAYAFLLRKNRLYLMDFEQEDIYFLIYTSLLQIFFVGIFVFFIWRDVNVHLKKAAVSMAMIFYIFLNIYFTSKYVYFYDSFSEKQVMIEIGEAVGEGYVLGGYSHGYTLYNDIKPIVNYDEQIDYMRKINCMLDYATWENMEYTIRKKMYNSERYLLEIRYAFQRSMKTYGERKPIGLMSYKEKGEINEKN